MSVPRLRPEEAAVLLLSRDERTAEEEKILGACLGSERLSWPALWAEADEQQVLPLVARALDEPSVGRAVPARVGAEVRAVRTRFVVHALTLHAELRRLGKAFKAADVPIVPLKGTELSVRLYGTVDRRQTGDIDILVSPERLPEARAVLRAAGYAQLTKGPHGVDEHLFHGAPWVRTEGDAIFVVELHWGLTDPRFVTIDYEALWRRIMARGIDEHGFGSLPDEELLVFLSTHLWKHDVGLLRLLADVDRLVRRAGPTMDWLYVLALAERWSAAWLLYFALERSNDLLGTPLPYWAMLRLRPAGWRRAVVGVLAGTRRVLRPPPIEHLRNNSFRFAYCVMLHPMGRTLDALRCYFFGAPPHSTQGPPADTVATLYRLGHGIAWMMLVLGSAFLSWPDEERASTARQG